MRQFCSKTAGFSLLVISWLVLLAEPSVAITIKYSDSAKFRTLAVRVSGRTLVCYRRRGEEIFPGYLKRIRRTVNFISYQAPSSGTRKIRAHRQVVAQCLRAFRSRAVNSSSSLSAAPISAATSSSLASLAISSSSASESMMSSSSQSSLRSSSSSSTIISSSSSGTSSSRETITQCNDGIDNDRDGRIDSADPGCGSRGDNSERSACDSYTIYNGIAGEYATAANLSQYGIVDNQAVFFPEGQFGRWPRRFCWHGVCEDSFGVIPQVGVDNLAAHLAALRDYVVYRIPNPNFDGWVVVDIEAWSPFGWRRTGFPRLDSIYKELSRARVRQNHREIVDPAMIEALAEAEFDEAGVRLYVESLRLIKQLRPHSKVALYDFPLAFPYDSSWGYLSPIYSAQNREINDLLQPIWDVLDGYSPVLYIDVPTGWRGGDGYQQTYHDNTYWIESVFVEIARLQATAGAKFVMPIVWHRYFDGGNAPYSNSLLSPQDLGIQLTYPFQLSADGVIIWGNELDPWGTQFGEYARSTMGPAVRSFCAAE